MFSGKVPQFMFNDETNGGLVEDGSLDQTVPSLGSPVNTSPGIERVERFSRKVFVGGLPPDIDEGLYTPEFTRVSHVSLENEISSRCDRK